MKLISSYPRSGQAKLRFLICNILYPEIEHDFATIRKYTPSIDSAEQLNNCADNVKFLFTHSNIRADVYLHRHVGDVLISEYWYKKKIYGLNIDLDGWLLSSDYGKEWRKSIEAGRGATKRVSFDQLNNAAYLADVLGFTVEQVDEGLKRCSFDQMKDAEHRNDIIKGDSTIDYMRSGKSEQWRQLYLKMQYKVIQDNEGELEYLGYWRPEDWEPILKAIQQLEEKKNVN